MIPSTHRQKGRFSLKISLKETLVPSFMRVQRGCNTARQVTLLRGHVASSGYGDLTPQDFLAVLDMSDDETMESSLRPVTSLTGSASIQRAA